MKNKKLWLSIIGLLLVAVIVVSAVLIANAVSKKKGPTMEDITNDSNELIYNGGNAVVVGDYVYFGNAYTPIGTDTDSKENYPYETNAKIAYLNRAHLSTLENKSALSPTGNEKGQHDGEEKVIGYENQYMFVLGDYVYYTSAFENKIANGLKHDYTQVSFWRCRLNGADPTRFYTAEQFTKSTDNPAASAKIIALKGSDENYYLVIYDGSQLTSIRLGANLGEAKVLAKDVDSVAFQNEKDECSVRKIVYTTKHLDENGDKTNQIDVFAIDYATGDKTDLSDGSSTSNVALLGRVNDYVFYTNADTDSNKTYRKDLTENTKFNGVLEEVCYDTPEVSMFMRVGINENRGYIFAGVDETTIRYYNYATKETVNILSNNDRLGLPKFSAVLFTDQNYVYYTTESGVERYSVLEKKSETMIEMENIVADAFSFDGEYLYFYSQIIDDPESEVTYEVDTNSYMYRVKCDGEENYQMLSTFTRKEAKDTSTT